MLPSWNRQGEILQLIRDNQVVVLSGETGCGKTTQVICIYSSLLDTLIITGSVCVGTTVYT